MNFSEVNGPIGEPNLRDTFPFPPTPSAVELSQATNLPNSRPNCRGFNLREWAEQLKMHGRMVPKSCSIRQWKREGDMRTAARRETE